MNSRYTVSELTLAIIIETRCIQLAMVVKDLDMVQEKFQICFLATMQDNHNHVKKLSFMRTLKDQMPQFDDLLDASQSADCWNCGLNLIHKHADKCKETGQEGCDFNPTFGKERKWLCC